MAGLELLCGGDKQGKHFESGLKTGLNFSLSLHQFCVTRIRCLSKGGQEGVDIHVDKFLSLIDKHSCGCYPLIWLPLQGYNHSNV